MVLTSRFIMNLRETNTVQDDTRNDGGWGMQDDVLIHDLAFERDPDIWTVSTRPFDTQSAGLASEHPEPSSSSPHASESVAFRVRAVRGSCPDRKLTSTSGLSGHVLRLSRSFIAVHGILWSLVARIQRLVFSFAVNKG